MSARDTAAVFAISALLLGCTSVAQTMLPPDDRPIARVSATEIALDLVVLDKNGRFVRTLKPADVEIYEGSVRQEITSLRLVAAAGLPPAEARKGEPPAVPATKPPGAVRSMRALNLVCLVFHNLDPVARSRAVAAAREFLDSNLPPETLVGLFTLGTRLNAVYPFTQQVKPLAEVLPRAFALPGMDIMRASELVLTASPTHIYWGMDEIRIAGGEVSPSSLAGADVSTQTAANVGRGQAVLDKQDFGHITGAQETDSVNEMITQLGQLPGRKLVLLLTTGLLTTGDPDRFQRIVDRAKAANIAFYPLDVSGLRENSTAQSSNLALNQAAGVSRAQTVAPAPGAKLDMDAAKERSKQGDSVINAVRNSDTQAALRELADNTGGFLTANTFEFRKPFQRIADDLGAHYELTYRPASAANDGRLHKIAVKLSHPDWRAESRTGYFALPASPDSKPGLAFFEAVGLAAMEANPRPHAFEFHTAAFQFRPSAEHREISLQIEVPAANLTARPVPERNIHAVWAQLISIVRDANGEIVHKFSADAPYEIPSDRLSELREAPLVYERPLRLPPGRYTVDTAVIDRQAQRASTDHAEFEIAASRSRLAMSSAVLIRRVEPASDEPDDVWTRGGKRVIPIVHPVLATDTAPRAYFVIYPDESNSEKPTVTIDFRVDDKLLQTETLENVPAPDGSGAIPMTIRAAAPAGACELDIIVTQGGETVSRSLKFTVVSK